MSVVFEFQVSKDFHFSNRFAEHFNAEVKDNRVYLPEFLGIGYIQEVYLSNGLFLCIHKYHLKQPFILRRIDSPAPNMLTFKFDCRRMPFKLTEEHYEPIFLGSNGCEVEFGTSDHFTELTLPPDKEINFLVIGTNRDALLKLLELNETDSAAERLLQKESSFIVHEIMSPEMERILKQMNTTKEANLLSSLHYKTKAQELILLLLSKLLRRPANAVIPVDHFDAKKIFEIREIILSDMSQTPDLTALAKDACMSLTKMKVLFKQIFGYSIYNYYQAARMNQATYLLKNFTVSETGYKLGFSNLSHFSRLFEKHFEVKPKRYKNSLTFELSA